MIKILEKNPVITLSIVIVLMLLVHLDVPNITIMEARNFITAREIVQDNNWLLTTMNGEPRYEKPPLPTWLTAISGLLFGMKNLFALRLPAAIMVLFLGVFIYFFSKKLKLSNNHALNNALISVTSFYIFAIINEAPWDIFAHGFMLASIYFLFKLLTSNRAIWKHVVYAALFFGFSFLSKGPIALYALFLPFIISFGIVYKFKNFKQKLFPFISFILLGLIVGGWWFLYVRFADPQAFLEIATKETGNWSSYNVKPFYYYWSFFIQSGIWTIPAFISLLYPYLIKKVQHKKVYKFSFWWTIVAVILLSAIPEKKARYLVPVLIPLALNTGFYIQYLITNFSELKNKKETLPVYFNFGLIATLAVALPIGLMLLLKENLQLFLLNVILTSITSIITGVLIVKNLYLKKIKSVFYTTLLFVVVLLLFGLPISKNFNKNGSYNSISKLQNFEQQQNITTYSIGDVTPEMLWKHNHKIKNIYKNELLNLPEDLNFGLLIMNNSVEKIKLELKQDYNLKLIEVYDLNVGSRKKERLIRQFYLVSKK